MANPLLPEHVAASHRSPEEWSALTAKLEAGVPQIIEQPAMMKRFLVPGRRFEFSFDSTPGRVNASICLEHPVYKIRLSYGLLSHYSGLARWMLTDEHLRDCFLLTKCYPNCDVSERFISEWFEWTIWHEVGHAACGHLRDRGSNGSVLKEFGEPDIQLKPSSEASLSMALELDADVAACNFFFIEIANHLKSGSAKKRYGSEYPEPYVHDLGASFAILFAFWQQLGQGRHGTTHPSATERAIVWYINAVDALQIYAPGDRDDYRDALLRGMTSVLYALGDDGSDFVKELRYGSSRLRKFKELVEESGFKARRQMRLPLDFSRNNVDPLAVVR